MALIKSSDGKVLRLPFVNSHVARNRCDKMENGAAIEVVPNAIGAAIAVNLGDFAIAVPGESLEQTVVAGYRSSSDAVDPFSELTNAAVRHWTDLTCLQKPVRLAPDKAVAK